MFFKWLAVGVFVLHGCASVVAGQDRDRSFDSDWRFHRGDASGAEKPAFDDSAWRTLDVPHDWSIEDLPPKSDTVPELEAVTDDWRFHAGDDEQWSARSFDDQDWEKVSIPATREEHSDHTGENVYGWFRRKIDIPADFQGREFILLMGYIDGADEVFLNGERIGGTGSFPPDYRTACNVDRRYRVPASLIREDGSDVLAVRVFDGAGGGGIVSAGVKSERVGPFGPVEIPVHFSVRGVGELAAQTSGEPNRPASFQDPVCTPFKGRCIAILRPTGVAGKVALSVRADGLNPVELTMTEQ